MQVTYGSNGAEPPVLVPVNQVLLFACNPMESGIMMLPAKN
jgi:hypothetical protein